MSVSDISPIAEFGSTAAPIGATQTKFDFTFPIINTTDIEVRFDGEVKPNSGDTAYTVAMQDGKGGSLTFTKAPKVTDPTLITLQIRRDTPFTRHTEYTDNGDLLAKTINDDFDRLWLCLQEERASADASLSRPAGAKYWEAQQMPISHLADGVADDDAATVKQVRQFTQNAQQSAAAAAVSKTGADTAKTGADTAKAAAVVAQGKAEAAQAAAEAARDATNATKLVVDGVAAKAANDAQTAAQAQIAPLVAQAKAQADAAAGSANTAAADASAAAKALIDPQVAAATAAKTAAQTAASTAAADAATAARAQIQPIADVATAAKNDANLKANAAAGSATAAAASATTAGQKATLASGYADNARNSATAAAASQTAAAQSAQTATDMQTATAGAAAASATAAATAAAASYTADAAVSAADALTAREGARNSREGAQDAQLGAEAAKAGAEAVLANLKAAALQKTANLSDVADKAAALLNLQAGNPLALAADGSAPGDAVTVRQLGKATGTTGATMNGVMNNYIGAVEWFSGKRTKLPAGYVVADGQTLNRADYPELWAAIDGGLLSAVSEALWINSTSVGREWAWRAQYSTGDLSKTFRVPDLNSAANVANPTPKGLFLSGNSGAPGNVERPANQIHAQGIPNIKGTISSIIQDNTVGTFGVASGAFNIGTLNAKRGTEAAGIANGASAQATFDASKSAELGASTTYGNSPRGELIPNSATGLWIIRAAGTFTADTSFSVIDSDATKPAAGSGVSGGEINSDYNAAGALLVRAQFKAVKAMGGVSTGRLTVWDYEKDPANPVSCALDLPTTPGQLVTSAQIGFGSISAPYWEDANTVKISGLYGNGGAAAKNVPSVAAYGPLLNMTRMPGSGQAQITVGPSGSMFVRGSADNGANWNPWVQVAYSNDYNKWTKQQSFLAPEHRLVRTAGQASYIVSRTSDSGNASQCWLLGCGGASDDVTFTSTLGGNGVFLYATGSVIIAAGKGTSSSTRNLTVQTDGAVVFPLGAKINTAFVPPSDERLKQNVAPAAPGALRRIASIELKEFNWRDGGQYDRGFIAQQIQKIDPLYVDATGEYLHYRQNVIIADLIGAVQELKKEIEELKASK